MAPKKSFRTYGRQNNSSINCVEAFDILFAKNLTQRKLYGKDRKAKNKIKFEIKELPTKIKTVLNDDSSLHVNVNDTFDRLLKKSPKYVKCSDARTTLNKSSFSVIKCLNSLSNASPMQQKLRSYNSDKSAINNAIDSWFNRATPPGHQITNNALEIEKVKPNRKKARKSRKASKSQSGRSSPILLRSQSQKLVTNSSFECEKAPMENNKSTTVPTTNNLLFTDSVRERILMHCSTPVASRKSQRLIGQPISPITNHDPVNNCIVESLNEIRSWNLSIPKFESLRCAKNDSIEAEPKRSLSFNLEDFESFFEQLKNKSQVLQHKSVSMDDFEQFHREIISCQFTSEGKVINNISLEEFESFYQSYQNQMSVNMDSFFDSCRKSFNFVTHRKHRFLTPKNRLSKKVHIMKDLVVLLDNNLMNYSASQRIKQDKAGCALINANNDNKQLTVKLTRLSLEKLKLTLNQSRTLFKAKKGRRCNSKFKACRKFSSNASVLLPNKTVTISFGGGNSGLADNSNISLGNIFNNKSRLEWRNGYANHRSVTGNEISSRSHSRWSDSFRTPQVNSTESPEGKTYDCWNKNKNSSMRMSVLKKSQVENLDITDQIQSESHLRKEERVSEEKPYEAKILVAFTNDNSRFEDLEALETSLELREASLGNSCTAKGHPTDLAISNADANTEYFAQDFSNSILVESPSTAIIEAPRRSSRLTMNNNYKSPALISVNPIGNGKNSLDCSIISIDDDDDDEKLDKFDNSIFKIPKARHQEVHLKAGKSWRRSLMQHKRESVIDLRRSQRLTDHVSHSPKIVASDDAKRLRRRTVLQSYVYSGMLNDTCNANVTCIPPRLTPETAPLAPITARDIVLTYCNQAEPVPFEKAYPKSLLKGCKKIGEGVYGEVFLYPRSDGSATVMKVIPIEGDKIVNGERQKKFHEILSEVSIVSQLSNLRHNVNNRTSAFCEVQRISCVKGKYPKVLLNVWYDYDNSKGSENDAPDLFDDDQLYVVLDLANAGQDLEAFVFNNASQAFAMFNQVALALAVAEEHLKFEHRDLHWGNILLRPVDKNKKIVFKHKGRRKECLSKGVEATIIDFTLSRMAHDGVVIFNDLGQDPDLFLAEGDYQFDIYRLMKEKNNNDWQKFTPYSNVLWLHYVVKKSITALRYKNSKTQIHKKYIESFKKYERDILRFNSVCEFVDEFL